MAERGPAGWRVLTGNEIGALLGWWLLRCCRQTQPDTEPGNIHFLASTVSSKILQTIATKEGVNFTETLTGFKHMGNQADKIQAQGGKVIFAFEEVKRKFG